MDYNKIKEIYLEILGILDKFLLANKDLVGDYYIDGAKNILTNKINIYIDYTNFSEIYKFFKPLLKQNLNILDLGCGLGDKAVVMKKMFPPSNIYGVETNTNDDPSHKENPPYKVFERVYPVISDAFNINLSLYDGYNLDFSDNTFDIAFLYAIIEHISPEHRKNFIKTISQKIKKDGYIVITRCPRYYSLDYYLLLFFQDYSFLYPDQSSRIRYPDSLF